MKKLAKILIPVFVLALVMSCVFIFASAEDNAASVTVGETTTEYATLAEAIAAANAESGNGAVVKLLKDVNVTSTIWIRSVDFTLDLGGHTLGGRFSSYDAANAIFTVGAPEGYSNNDDGDIKPLITGNGTINLYHAAIYLTDTLDGDYIMPSIGAEEALDEDYNQLEIVPIDTKITVNHAGQCRVVSLNNENDAFYAQNVDFNFSFNANIQDKTNGAQVFFSTTTDNTYIRLADCGVRMARAEKHYDNKYFSVAASNSYVQLDNCFVSTIYSVFHVKGSFNEVGTTAEIFKVNNSTIVAFDDAGSALTSGNLISAYDATSTSCGVIALKDSHIKAYRMFEGNTNSDTFISAVVVNAEGCTLETVAHSNSSVICRGDFNMTLTDCNLKLNGHQNHGLTGWSATTNKMVNCRFDRYLDGTYFDYSNSSFPFSTAIPENYNATDVFYLAGGDKVVGTGNGNKFLKEEAPRTYTISTSRALDANHNVYYRYEFAEGTSTQEPYWTPGYNWDTAYKKDQSTYTHQLDGTATEIALINSMDFATLDANETLSFRITCMTRFNIAVDSNGKYSQNNTSVDMVNITNGAVYNAVTGEKICDFENGVWYRFTLVVYYDASVTGGYTAKCYVNGTEAASVVAFPSRTETKGTLVEGIRMWANKGNHNAGEGFAIDNAYRVVYSSDSGLPASYGAATGSLNREAEYNGAYYNTLGDAIDAAKPGEVVHITGNVTSKLTEAQLAKGVIIDNSNRYEINPALVGQDDAIVDPATGSILPLAWGSSSEGAIATVKALSFSGAAVTDKYVYLAPAPTENAEKAAWAVFDKNNKTLDYSVSADGFDFGHCPDGSTVKLFSDVSFNGVHRDNLDMTGNVTFDLNGYKMIKNDWKDCSFHIASSGVTLNIKSSRPGAAIMAYVSAEAGQARPNDYNWSLNTGDAIFNVNGDNVTINIDGTNILASIVSLIDLQADAQGATVNINGGIYHQLGSDIQGIIYMRNTDTSAASKVSFKDATIILSGLNASYLTALASNTVATEVTIDGCTIIGDNNNGKYYLTRRLTGENAEFLIKNTTITATRNNWAQGLLPDNEQASAADITIGENVTTSFNIPEEVTYAQDCALKKLDIPYASIPSGTNIAFTSVIATYDGSTSASCAYRFKDSAGNTVLIYAGKHRSGLATANFSFDTDTKLEDSSKILYNATDCTTTAEIQAAGLTFRDYIWAFDTISMTDKFYDNNNVKACTYSSSTVDLSYTYLDEALLSGTAAASTDFENADIPSSVIPAGGVEGIYSLAGWKAAHVTAENGAVTVEIAPTAIENKLAISSTLILQNNLTYTILLKEEAMPYIRGFRIGEEDVLPEDTTLVSYNGVNYYAVYKTVNPSEFGVKFAVSATYAVTDIEGVTSNTVNWTLSIANYAKAVLTADGNATVNNEAKQLVAEVLNYVAAVDYYNAVETDADILAAIDAYKEAGFAPKEIETPEREDNIAIDNLSAIGLAIGENGFKLALTLDVGFEGTIDIVIDGRRVTINAGNVDTSSEDPEDRTVYIVLHAYEVVRDMTIGEQEYNLEYYFDYILNDNMNTTDSDIILINAIKAYAYAADAYMKSIQAE